MNQFNGLLDNALKTIKMKCKVAAPVKSLTSWLLVLYQARFDLALLEPCTLQASFDINSRYSLFFSQCSPEEQL